MRMLGIDWGERRIGLAVSDPDGQVAVPVATLEVSGERQALEGVAAAGRERECRRMVMGLPLNMDGTEGAMARKTRAFAEKLEKRTGLPVVLLDERLSSWSAERQLHAANRKCSRRDGLKDKLAARIILQEYLDSTKESAWPCQDSRSS